MGGGLFAFWVYGFVAGLSLICWYLVNLLLVDVLLGFVFVCLICDRIGLFACIVGGCRFGFWCLCLMVVVVGMIFGFECWLGVACVLGSLLFWVCCMFTVD